MSVSPLSERQLFICRKRSTLMIHGATAMSLYKEKKTDSIECGRYARSTLVVRVHTALLNDPVVRGNEIDVTAQNGVVVLRGQVHDAQEADAAIAIAHRIEGVRGVQSELQTDG